MILSLLGAWLVAALIAGYVRDRGWVLVASVATLQAREVLYLPGERVFVVVVPDGLVALSALSPHQGERVLYCRRASVFQDVHGDRFDRTGMYLLGPAPRGMDRVAVRIRGDEVQVKPSATTPGRGRGSDAQPPTGPFCPGAPVEASPGFAAETASGG